MKNPAVIGAVLVALITGSLGPISVSMVQDRQEAAREEQRISAGVIDQETLLGHSLFTHASTWTDIIIPQMDVSEEAEVFLQIKFTAFQESLEALVRDTGDFDLLSDHELHALLTRNLNQTVESYIAEARRENVSEEWITDFNIYHAQIVSLLVSAIEDTARSPVFSSQNAKMYAVLTAYDSALSSTIEDVKRTLLKE